MPIVDSFQPETTNKISVSWALGFATKAQAFACQNQLPIIKDLSKCREWCFYLDAQGWSIIEGADKQSKPFRLHFSSKFAGNGKDPLLKAMGKSQNILDLTAGWGNDALHIAMSGRAVLAVERHDIIYKLLVQAHSKLRGGLAQRLNFMHLDAADEALLQDISPEKGPENHYELVYLDPMFANKSNKKANAKRPMYIMQQLVGASSPENDARLFDIAMRIATRRVVVKRALKAPYITDLEPQGSIKSKLVRFDLYKPSGHNTATFTRMLAGVYSRET